MVELYLEQKLFPVIGGLIDGRLLDLRETIELVEGGNFKLLQIYVGNGDFKIKTGFMLHKKSDISIQPESLLTFANERLEEAIAYKNRKK